VQAGRPVDPLHNHQHDLVGYEHAGRWDERSKPGQDLELTPETLIWGALGWAYAAGMYPKPSDIPKEKKNDTSVGRGLRFISLKLCFVWRHDTKALQILEGKDKREPTVGPINLTQIYRVLRLE